MKLANETVETLDLRLKYISQCQKAELKKPKKVRDQDEIATLTFTKALLRLEKADALYQDNQSGDAHKYYKLAVKNLEDVISMKSKRQGSIFRTLRSKGIIKNAKQGQFTADLMYLHELTGSVIFHNVADDYIPENLNRGQKTKIRKASEHFDDAMVANQERGIDRIDLKHRRADTKAMRVGVRGRYHTQAINLYNQVLEETDNISNVIPALFSKGLSHYRLGQYEAKRQYEGNATPSMYSSARECFLHVLSLNDQHVHAINGIGNLEMMNNDPQEALKLFEKANSIDRQYAPARYNQGVCFKSMGSYQKAIDQFVNAMEATNSNHTMISRSAEKLAYQLHEELTQWREIGITIDTTEARQAVHDLLNNTISKKLRTQVIGNTTRKVRVPNGDGGYDIKTEITDPIGHAMKESCTTLRDMFVMLTTDLDNIDRNNGRTYVIRFMKNLGITNRHDYFQPMNKLIEQCECGDAGYILGYAKKSQPVLHVNGYDYLTTRNRPDINCPMPRVIEFKANFENAEFSSTFASEYIDDSELSDDDISSESTSPSLSISSPTMVQSSASSFHSIECKEVSTDSPTTTERRDQYQRSPRFFSSASRFQLSVQTKGEGHHKVRIDIETNPSAEKNQNFEADSSDSSDLCAVDSKPQEQFKQFTR